MFRYAIIVALLLCPQAGPQAPPVFRAGVDLIVVEASVVDRQHQPIADLRAEDFRALVDGKPRPVKFARYFGSEREASSFLVATGDRAAPGFVSNLSRPPGQTLIFAIDLESIRPGGEKVLLNSVTPLVDALPAHDAVGLVVLDGVTVDLSRDHGRVRDALRRLTGTRPPSLVSHEVTYQDAVAITDRNDSNVFMSVLSRECRPPRQPLPDPDFELCKSEIRAQSRDMVLTTRLRAQKLLSFLSSVMTSLKDIDGPKQIVLVSAGLPFDYEFASVYRNLTQQAAEARAIVHAIHLDDAGLDAANGKFISSPYGSREMTPGLASIATTTGGSFYDMVSHAAVVVEQLARDFNHFYQLGIERSPNDGDRKIHHLEIVVSRPGAEVRSRSEIAAVDPPKTNSDKLLALFQQPIDVADLSIEASAYALRGATPGTVKVILASQLGASVPLRAPIEWGYIVLNHGKPTADGRLRLDPATTPAVATASVTIPAGDYDVRLAAVDADGRGGVLQLPLHAQLHAAGDLQMSDLVVAPATGNRLEPRATIPRGTRLVAMTELYANDAGAFDGVELVLDVAVSESGQSLVAQPIKFQPAGDPNTRAAQATIDSALLDPGGYTLTLIAKKAGQEIGRVARAIQIVP